MSPLYNLLVVLGPTASGKTQLGVQLCQKLGGEVISADSRQVYRGMDIGTGKDLEDYGNTPYHLVDIVDPGYEFNLFEYQRQFFATFSRITRRGKLPVLVGGTGLYLDAVLKGYHLTEVPRNPELRTELDRLTTEELTARLIRTKPKQHNNTDLVIRERLTRAIEIAEGEKNPPPERLPPLPILQPVIFGTSWEREHLKNRIEERLRDRLEQGMITEVENLHKSGISYVVLESFGLEYRFVAWYLQGKITRNDLFQQLYSAICKFAKRQTTWFRRMERQGTRIHWLEGNDSPLEKALEILREPDA